MFGFILAQSALNLHPELGEGCGGYLSVLILVAESFYTGFYQEQSGWGLVQLACVLKACTGLLVHLC